jgi:hypothetical protein
MLGPVENPTTGAAPCSAGCTQFTRKRAAAPAVFRHIFLPFAAIISPLLFEASWVYERISLEAQLLLALSSCSVAARVRPSCKHEHSCHQSYSSRFVKFTRHRFDHKPKHTKDSAESCFGEVSVVQQRSTATVETVSKLAEI